MSGKLYAAPLAICLLLASSCTLRARVPDAAAVQATVVKAVDATLTAQRATTLMAPTRVTTPVPTAPPRPSAADASGDNLSEPTPAPPTDTSAPTPTLSTQPGQFVRVQIRQWEYTIHGRPAGMDDPSQGCGPFDKKHPIVMLTASLRVVNKSDRELRDWYGYFFTPSGESLYTCHQLYETVPAIPAGGSLDITFTVFMEKTQVKVHGYIEDQQLGRSNEVTF